MEHWGAVLYFCMCNAKRGYMTGCADRGHHLTAKEPQTEGPCLFMDTRDLGNRGGPRVEKYWGRVGTRILIKTPTKEVLAEAPEKCLSQFP